MKRNEIITEMINLTRIDGFIYSLSYLILKDLYPYISTNIGFVNYYEKIIPYEFEILLEILVSTKNKITYPRDFKKFTEMIMTSRKLLGAYHQTFKPDIGKYLQPKHHFYEKINTYENDLETIFYSGYGMGGLQILEFLQKTYKYDKKHLENKHNFNIDNVSKFIQCCDDNIKEKISKLPFRHCSKNDIKNVNSVSDEDLEYIQVISFSYYVLLKLKKDPYIDDNLKYFYDLILDLFIIDGNELKYKDAHVYLDNFVIEKTQYKPTQLYNLNVGQYFRQKPVIKIDDNRYFLPSMISLYNAVYSSPYYWLIKDKDYNKIASDNRGNVAEEITLDFMTEVFGKDNTFQSVKIKKGKEDHTDIDVVCFHKDIALIFQVKNKKITELAKQGDFVKFYEDFNKAYQSAYDQGLKCSEAIKDPSCYKFYHNSKNFAITNITKTYIFCITVDNISSISYLFNENIKKSSKKSTSIALSIYELEILVKYLSIPIDFIKYLEFRESISNSITAVNEISVLGYYFFYTKRYGTYVNSKTDTFIDQTFAQLIDNDYLMHKYKNYPIKKTMYGMIKKMINKYKTT